MNDETATEMYVDIVTTHDRHTTDDDEAYLSYPHYLANRFFGPLTLNN